jgi:hypothetical protein
MYIYAKAVTPTYRCYDCNTKIAAEDIDFIYHNQLQVFLHANMDIAEYKDKAVQLIEERETRLKALTELAAPIRKKMDNLVNLRLSGDMPEEDFPRYYHPLKEQLDQIEIHIPELEAEIAFLHNQSLSSESLLEDTQSLHRDWESFSFEEKRGIIESITEKVVVDGEDITISLRRPPATLLTEMEEKGNATSWIHRSYKCKTCRVFHRKFRP